MPLPVYTQQPQEPQQQKKDSNPFMPPPSSGMPPPEEAVQPQQMARPVPNEPMQTELHGGRSLLATDYADSFGGPSAGRAPPQSSTLGGFLQPIQGDIVKIGSEATSSVKQFVGGTYEVVAQGAAKYEAVTQPIRNVTQGPALGTPGKLGQGNTVDAMLASSSPAQGPTQQQRNREAAFLAAGIVPGGDVFELGIRGGESFLASVGSKIGVGAAFGGSTAALKGGSPTQIGESAAFGAAFFGAGSLAGNLGGKVAGGLESSAAAGRYADITGEGPSFSQKFAMFVTKSQTEAPPVGGAGSVKALGIGPEGEPLGIPPGAKPVGKGFATIASEPTQPPVDLSNFLQDFERSFPTKGTKGFFEGEQLPGPPTKSTPAPATQSPYSGAPGTPFKVDFGAGGGRNISSYQSRSLFSGEYAIKAAEEPPAVSRTGPAGAGYKAGGISNEASFSEATTSLRTPPGFSETTYRDIAFQQPSTDAASGFRTSAIPGYGAVAGQSAASVSGSAVKITLPPIGKYGSGQLPGSGLGSSSQQGQQQGIGQGQGQGIGSGILKTTQGSGITIQTTTQGQGTQQQTPSPSFADLTSPVPSPSFLKARGESGSAFAGFASSPSMPSERKGRPQTYGFREKKHPISNILTGGSLDVGLNMKAFKMKRGKRK